MLLNKEAIVLQYNKTRDPSLKVQIVELYKPLVDYIARKLSYNKSDVEDLSQVGTIGLLRSLERFDPSMDTDFSTFATPNIIGEIKHYFRDKRHLVKVPRKLQELYSKVKKYIKEHQVDGKMPPISEIALSLEVSDEKVIESIEASKSVSVLSLDNPTSSKNSYRDSGGYSLLDSIGVAAKDDFYLDKVTLNEALSTLTARERKILRLRYFSGLSQTEIAIKMKLSQMHISRLLTKSIQKLKKLLEAQNK